MDHPTSTAPATQRPREPLLVRMMQLTRLRGPRSEGMVENRPVLDFVTHAVLILGVAVIAFPVYVTFVASTVTAEEVLAAPMSLVPGPHLIDNYREAWVRGAGNSAAPVGQMMMNSLITALVITCWLGSSSVNLIATED